MKRPLIFVFTLVVLATSSPPQKTLGEELKDFRALVPLNKIHALVFYYFGNDAEFQELVNYILSQDVLPAFQEIEAIPEVQTIIEYLHQRGSDIKDLLNKLHNLLGLEPYYKPAKTILRKTGGLVGFVDELKALIPEKELHELYDHKLKTSPVFREFVDFLKSPNSQTGMDKILANVHVQNLLKFIKSKKVDLKVFEDFITGLIGIQFKPHDNMRSKKPFKMDFTKDVSEFLSLVPTSKVVACGSQYMKTSKNFRLGYMYLMSKMFEKSVKAVRKTTEGKELMKYLQMHGFDIKKYLKESAMRFGFYQYNAQNANPNDPPKTGCMTAFVKDVKMLLPRDQIHSLAVIKIQTVPNYSNFTRSLQSTELHGIYNKLVGTPEAKMLSSEAAEYGVHLQDFIELAYSVLDLKFKQLKI